MDTDDLIEQVVAFIKAHEAWEAALILDDVAWKGGSADYPTITHGLYDAMMGVQAIRNDLKKAVVKYLKQGCKWDTDGDGNCAYHPNGCPPELRAK